MSYDSKTNGTKNPLAGRAGPRNSPETVEEKEARLFYSQKKYEYKGK